MLDAAMRQATIGMRLEETLGLWRTWFPGANLEREPIRRRLADGMAARLPAVALKPGAVEAVRLCREAGCRLAVASSSPADFRSEHLL